MLITMFLGRERVERNMTRRELLAYDNDLVRAFRKEEFTKRLLHALDEEWGMLTSMHHLEGFREENEEAHMRQLLKQGNFQNKFNYKLKNEQAFYKELAFSARKTAEIYDNRR